MCIDERLLSAYLDGSIAEPYKTQVAEHLSYCSACRARLEKFAALDEKIRRASPESEELTRKKDDTFSCLEKKYFSKNSKKISFFHRKVVMGIPSMVTAAAGLVIVFIGGFVLFGTNSSQTSEIVPSFNVHADSNNLQFVSQKEKTLDSYSLEEILQYLNNKGYDVDISIKGLKPIAEPVTE
jgi:Predicted transmembrane transcriptional regulator (anti-sigma factor)